MNKIKWTFYTLPRSKKNNEKIKVIPVTGTQTGTDEELEALEQVQWITARDILRVRKRHFEIKVQLIGRRVMRNWEGTQRTNWRSGILQSSVECCCADLLWTKLPWSGSAKHNCERESTCKTESAKRKKENGKTSANEKTQMQRKETQMQKRKHKHIRQNTTDQPKQKWYHFSVKETCAPVYAPGVVSRFPREFLSSGSANLSAPFAPSFPLSNV